MQMLTQGVLLSASLVVASGQATNVCIGEFSTCPAGDCALVVEECGRCAPGQYACPLSSSCSPDGGFKPCPGLAGTHFDSSLTVEQRLDYIFAQQLTLPEMLAQMTDNATSIPRLDIPSYVWLNDDQHGVKEPDATAFPNGVSLGATWDTALLRRVGLAIGTEARGVHNSLLDKSAETGGEGWPGKLRNGAGLTFYAPNINIARPRWGRAQEVMGECPHLTARLVEFYVSGLQNSTRENAEEGPLLGAACCKHFAAYNVENIPVDRTVFNAVVDVRNLWETYLPAFEACITGGHSQSVMCSYNAINGIPTCAEPGLLNTILRKQLNFSGFVVSDYDAWANLLDTHHYVPTYSLAASAGLNGGMDQEGGGGPTYPPVQVGIPQAIAAGNLTLATVEQAVRRLLRVRIRLGMFSDPTTQAYTAITHAAVASPANQQLAEQAAREGMVLLKNNPPGAGTPAGASALALPPPSLPLSLSALSGMTIAVLGPNANASYILLGSYSDTECCTSAGGIPTFYNELLQRAAPANVGLNYVPGCVNASCLTTDGFAPAAAAAAAADAVIIVLGMGQTAYACGGDKDRTACESEGYDRLTCALPGQQPGLVAAIKAATKPGVPIIGVFVHGGAFCFEDDTLHSLDAILDAFYPGQRGGPAMADAIIGAFSPAGRSPVTFYASDASLPSDRSDMSNYQSATSPGLSFMYYGGPLSSPPVFTFGEGLSYTTFAASRPTAPSTVRPCDDIPLSVTIDNTGSVDSDIVVQVFLATPGVSVPAPISRLVSFLRVFVPAGGSLLVTLPPVSPFARAVVHDDGSNIYDVTGKRWGEPGPLLLRVCLGEHDCARAGGVAWGPIAQSGPAQDLSTCY
jgi:beta-glucosidase-like glycosyl hydrolase